MADINIFGTLNNTTGDPIVRSNQVEGGYMVVANSNELAAMPNTIVKEGSLAYNQDDNKFYQYDGTRWNVADFGGGGSVTTVNADLEYNLSTELRRKEGSIEDEIANITTTLVSFAFENNEVPDVDFANIKVNTTLNLTLTQQGSTQSATYHIESHGTFTKMKMSMEGLDQQTTWIHITVPAYEQYETPSNIELVGINGQYRLFNEFGYLVNELYEKADKEDLATVATSGDYDDLSNKPSIPENVTDLADADNYALKSDLATVATSGDYDDLINKPTIPTKTSDLENDKKFVSIAEPINVEGYKQLLYIEANGAQAIETSIIPNQNTSFDLDYMSYDAPTSNNSPQIINAGGRGTQPRMAVSLWVASKLSGEVMINTTSSTAKMSANVRSLLRYVNDGTSKKIIYSDNTTTNLTINDFEAVGSIIIFALKNGNVYDRFFRGRLYGLKLYNQTTLTHNFVPAMRLADNEIGLLDVADNNTFYTNNGTGAFGYGELNILTRVSELVMDRNIITDNNFTNAYKNQIQQNANDIAAIQALLPTLTGLHYEVVNELPTQDISTSTIYLVPKSQSGTHNIYNEYVYVNDNWELIGDTEIDLTNYVTKDGVKTINNESILGTGNITIEGGGNVHIDAVNNWAIFTEGNDEYFVPVTKIAAPSTPTITTTTYSIVTGNANVAISGESGATISCSLDNGETWTTGSTIPIASGFSNDADNTTVTQGVRVKATKYGKDSVIGMYTITINPKVAQPSLTTNNPDQYAASATVVISKSASKDALTEYTTDGGTNWIELEQASLTITVTENKSAGTYRVRATKQDYVDSAISQSSAIVLNLPYIYYGVTTAAISESVVKGLTKLAEGKSNKTLSYTAAAQYAVFAYPSSYGTLTHILDPNGYENISGWSADTLTIDGAEYKVYHTDDKLTCNNFVYRFQF
jgi:hypothetical protein